MTKYSNKSILFKISALITALCLIITAYSVFGLYLGWTNYQQSIELSTVRDMAQNFSDGLKNFMFERGRMNVVLAKEQPISEENRVFLHERRTAADKAFEAGFAAMEKVFPKEAENLRKEYEDINALRLKVGTEAEKPSPERDGNVRKLWFRGCTDYINTVIAKINVIRRLSRNNSDITNYFDVIVGSLNFRSIVGNESSIITSAISSSGEIRNEDNSTLLFLMGEEKQVWSGLENTVSMLDSEDLKAALENVREQYYLQFRPEQERIIELAQNKQLYEGADIEIANLSVPALDSVWQLSDEACMGIESESQKIIEKGFRSFLAGLFQLLIGILTIVFVPSYFRRKFVHPLNNIILTLKDISDGNCNKQTPYMQRADEIGKLAHGADMLKNSIIEEQTLKQELEETVIKLKDLSVKDSLTGLYNRRYMEERFEEMAKRFKRNDKEFSVIMCDIDNFKSFNDRYGHECGDKVLVNISAQLSSYCREADLLARWGGEEFLFLLPDTDSEGARILAERARKGLESSAYKCDLSCLNVTMTFGVAEYSEEAGIQETIRKADMALLEGKNNGRNQVVVFDVEKLLFWARRRYKPCKFMKNPRKKNR